MIDLPTTNLHSKLLQKHGEATLEQPFDHPDHRHLYKREHFRVKVGHAGWFCLPLQSSDEDTQRRYSLATFLLTSIPN